MLKKTKKLIYQPEDRDLEIEVMVANETVWMTQKSIAMLCQTTPQNITIHIKSISSVLDLQDGTRYYVVQKEEGGRIIKSEILHYNLDVVFNIAIRGRYFEEFNKLVNYAKTNGVKKDYLVYVPVKERRFGEMLKKSLKGIADIYDQFKVAGYIVDFYIPQLDLVVEYDEKHHEKQFIDDEIRQEYIERKLGVQFIRVNEGEEFQGINQIIRFLLRNNYWNRGTGDE